MKKTLWIVILVILALGALGVGVVAAQDGQPPYGQRGVADGAGPMHDYMEEAMADAVGLSVEEFEARHDAGETFYQIALAEGFTAEEIPALMQDCPCQSAGCGCGSWRHHARTGRLDEISRFWPRRHDGRLR